MEKVEVFLLGPPRVYINKKRYLFPYGRAEGMFYYLVTKGYENKQILETSFGETNMTKKRPTETTEMPFIISEKPLGRIF